MVRTCKIEGCNKPVYGYGWCAAHYGRWRSHGDPIGGRAPSHGHAGGNGRTPEYTAWRNMINRCTNPGVRSYPRYGGRGIAVCGRWRQNFAAFLADVGFRPGPGYTLDRIDSNGDYEPGNCRWATQVEQQNNRRDNHVITFGGVSKTLSEWARDLGIAPATLQTRINRRGWSLERALSGLERRRRAPNDDVR
jgi:hypothetical protein